MAREGQSHSFCPQGRPGQGVLACRGAWLGIAKSRGLHRISQETPLTPGCPFPSCPARLCFAVSPLCLWAGLCGSQTPRALLAALPDLTWELHLELGRQRLHWEGIGEQQKCLEGQTRNQGGKGEPLERGKGGARGDGDVPSHHPELFPAPSYGPWISGLGKSLPSQSKF